MTNKQKKAIEWFLQIAKTEEFRIVTGIVAKNTKSSPVSDKKHIMHYKSGKNDGVDAALDFLINIESLLGEKDDDMSTETSQHPDLNND